MRESVFVKNGAADYQDVDVKNYGVTALIWVVRVRYEAIVRLLLFKS